MKYWRNWVRKIILEIDPTFSYKTHSPSLQFYLIMVNHKLDVLIKILVSRLKMTHRYGLNTIANFLMTIVQAM